MIRPRGKRPHKLLLPTILLYLRPKILVTNYYYKQVLSETCLTENAPAGDFDSGSGSTFCPPVVDTSVSLVSDQKTGGNMTTHDTTIETGQICNLVVHWPNVEFDTDFLTRGYDAGGSVGLYDSISNNCGDQETIGSVENREALGRFTDHIYIVGRGHIERVNSYFIGKNLKLNNVTTTDLGSTFRLYAHGLRGHSYKFKIKAELKAISNWPGTHSTYRFLEPHEFTVGGRKPDKEGFVELVALGQSAVDVTPVAKEKFYLVTQLYIISTKDFIDTSPVAVSPSPSAVPDSNRGFTPVPPQLNSVSPQAVKSGDSITIIGSGFSSIGNSVRFANDAGQGYVIANLPSDGNTVAFTVPRDISSTTSFIQVSAFNSALSNRLPFQIVANEAAPLSYEVPPAPPRPSLFGRVKSFFSKLFGGGAAPPAPPPEFGVAASTATNTPPFSGDNATTTDTSTLGVRQFVLNTLGKSVQQSRDSVQTDAQLQELANGSIIKTWKIKYEKKGHARFVCDPPVLNVSFDKKDKKGNPKELFTGISTYPGKSQLQYQKIRMIPLCEAAAYYSSSGQQGYGFKGKVDANLREYTIFAIMRLLGVPVVDVVGFANVSFVSSDPQYDGKTFQYMLLARDNEQDDELPFTEQFNLEPLLVEEGKATSQLWNWSYGMLGDLTYSWNIKGKTTEKLTMHRDTETLLKELLIGALMQDGDRGHNKDYGKVKNADLWKNIPYGFDYSLSSCTFSPDYDYGLNLLKQYMEMEIAKLSADQQKEYKAAYYRVARELFSDKAVLKKMHSSVDRFPFNVEAGKSLLHSYIDVAFYSFGVYFSSREFANYAGVSYEPFSPLPFFSLKEYDSARADFYQRCSAQPIQTDSGVKVEIISSSLKAILRQGKESFISEDTVDHLQADFKLLLTAPDKKDIAVSKQNAFLFKLIGPTEELTNFMYSPNNEWQISYHRPVELQETTGPSWVIPAGKTVTFLVSVQFPMSREVGLKAGLYTASLARVDLVGDIPVMQPPADKTNSVLITTTTTSTLPLVATTTTVSISFKNSPLVPPANIFVGTTTTPLGGFTAMPKGEPVSVRNLRFRVAIGGGGGATGDLSNIRLYDSAGGLVVKGGTDSNDSSDGLIFKDEFKIATTTDYEIRATLGPRFKAGQTIQLSTKFSKDDVVFTGTRSGKDISVSKSGLTLSKMTVTAAPAAITILSSCGEITKSGNYSIVNDLSATNVPCLNIRDTQDVHINCNNHLIAGKNFEAAVQIKNVENFSIESCRLSMPSIKEGATVAISDAKNGEVKNNHIDGESMTAYTSTNLVIKNNAFTSIYHQSYTSKSVIENNTFILNPEISPGGVIALDFGEHNRISGNYINGLAKGLSNDEKLHSDDGIILLDERYDLIENNTIDNNYDCGIETEGFITSTTIQGNIIKNIGYCGIGAWFWSSWLNNTVFNNTVNDSPSLFQFYRVHGMRPAGFDVPYGRQPADQNLFFKDNVFSNNKLVNQRSQAKVGIIDIEMNPQGSLGSMGERLPTAQEVIIGNNKFSNNDFGSLASVVFFPVSMIVDGGGNICGKTSTKNYPLECGQ